VTSRRRARTIGFYAHVCKRIEKLNFLNQKRWSIASNEQDNILSIAHPGFNINQEALKLGRYLEGKSNNDIMKQMRSLRVRQNTQLLNKKDGQLGQQTKRMVQCLSMF
jgi:hypothetical protein